MTRIKDALSCDGCVYLAQTQDGRPACAQFQRLVNVETDFCSWRIAAAHDPECCMCHRKTLGRAVHYNGQIYCQECAQRQI